jgi:hypothetical protein
MQHLRNPLLAEALVVSSTGGDAGPASPPLSPEMVHVAAEGEAAEVAAVWSLGRLRGLLTLVRPRSTADRWLCEALMCLLLITLLMLSAVLVAELTDVRVRDVDPAHSKRGVHYVCLVRHTAGSAAHSAEAVSAMVILALVQCVTVVAMHVVLSFRVVTRATFRGYASWLIQYVRCNRLFAVCVLCKSGVVVARLLASPGSVHLPSVAFLFLWPMTAPAMDLLCLVIARPRIVAAVTWAWILAAAVLYSEMAVNEAMCLGATSIFQELVAFFNIGVLTTAVTNALQQLYGKVSSPGGQRPTLLLSSARNYVDLR